MDFLPIFLDIKNRDCVVVGGGEVAARKVAMLLRAGARATVVSPQLGVELREQLQQGRINYCAHPFQTENLDGAVLAIAATSDPIVNQQVSEAAGQLCIPVNVVDNPALCSFIMPSILDRAPILVAISSGGASPVLTRLLRSRLETMIPSAYGRLAAYAADFREQVKSRFSRPETRRRFWESVLQGPFAEMVFAGKDRAAKAYLEHLLENEADDTAQREGSGEVSEEAKGEVYLVGAGPGDPELLTFRAMRLMQQADVVVYDRLVSPEILDMVRRDAPRIYAGKERSKHTMPQESINELLVRLAKEGKRVLRLKGGDPFIFGRGGEEIETLSGEGIPFQVVPGITAATGAASYAGIPLTHRDYAQSCIFVTGHLKDGSVDLDWPMLARPNQTIVIYMGLLGLPVLCRQLIEHGLPAVTPAAIVQQGTTHKQRVLTGSLATLPGLTASAKLIPPTLIIVGEVVKLHQRLAWFEPESDLHADEPAQEAGR
ncbi:uroporphyrin-III C-methyltransferase / precorrin-2 dehydrogenase / sirohydrochlorin ferrochelatase [Nitrosospira briensis]|uniref:Siroheme synthase n=1 Tax=Nitrosospira briensis TaxID=35799 RepID=A0A1I5CIX8_9PROT|nr:siroheme synthase CysG [Nitrosospira briensis]SFN86844.1 uroporphyrin-III C-methyltransferase / precorrin-2 dehydrogenase / sirohydrochlorin ferrochelatase [Nitrosospira briensis]